MLYIAFANLPLKCFYKVRTLGRWIILIYVARSWTREKYSWLELVDFVFETGNGLLRPLQIRSEIERAMQVVEELKPINVMEIGTASGGTFTLLSRAAAANAVLISLDLPGGRWGGGYSKLKAWFFKHLLLPGQSGHFIRQNSHDLGSLERAKEALNRNLLDLLFIDGDHSYEGVKADFNMYVGLVRPGGLVILHDIAHHREEFDCHVDRFWEEVKSEFHPLEIFEEPSQGWAGIGILRVPDFVSSRDL